MPSDQLEAKYDGQVDFSGGCRMVGEPQENEYRYASNIVVRDGTAKTRPGFRRAFRVLQAGFKKGFWFGDKGAGTGFWFPFDFVASVWSNVNGSCFYRFLGDTDAKQLIVADARVYVHDAGFVTELPVTNALSTTTNVQFVTGDQYIYLLRDDAGAAQYWDGTTAGFVPIPAGEPSSVPSHPNTGAYINGRFYVVDDRDDIYASDVYSPTNYDHANQLFSVAAGDGDEIVRILPYHDDYALVFKKKRIDYLAGINTPVVEGSSLADVISIGNVTKQYGLVAEKAVVVYGENVAFLSYKGVQTIRRVEEGKLMGSAVPLSAEIQPLIDRIAWDHVGCACAGFHDNYLFFAVPMDGATANNYVLVYDLLARGGEGAWVGLWEGDLLKPVEFVEDNEKFYFIAQDGSLKIMFSDDPWDSEDVFDDTPLWTTTAQYYTGDIVWRDKSGVETLWTAAADSLGTDPLTDSGTYWTEVTDPQHAYDISSEVRTRFYRHGHKSAAKRHGRCEVVVKHQNPKWSVDVESENYNTLETVVSDREYDRTKYDVCDKADWRNDNYNLDFANPYRKDYTAFIEAEEGVRINNSVSISGHLVDWTPSTAEYRLGMFGFVNGPALDPAFYYESPQIVATAGHIYQLTMVLKSYDVALGESPGGAGIIVLRTGTDQEGESMDVTTIDATAVVTFTATSSDLRIKYIPSFEGAPTAGFYTCLFTMELIDLNAFYMSATTGINLNIWTPHSARFYPRVLNNQAFALRIRNTQGRLAVTSVLNIAQQDRFAAKER